VTRIFVQVKDRRESDK